MCTQTDHSVAASKVLITVWESVPQKWNKVKIVFLFTFNSFTIIPVKCLISVGPNVGSQHVCKRFCVVPPSVSVWAVEGE